MIIKLRQDLIINFENTINNEFFLIDNFQLKFHKISIPIEFKKYIDLLILGIEYKNNIFYVQSNCLEEDININILNNIVLELDKYLLLKNDKSQNKLKSIIEYSKLTNRPNICEDALYSSDETLFINEISSILSKKTLNIKNNSISHSDFNLIFAPHLDYYSNQSVTEAYANIFNYINELEYDLVVYLGTAHFVNSALFMFCDKNYTSTLKNTFTDKVLINKILNDCSNYFINNNIEENLINNNYLDKFIKIDNLAHKNEHSIELHNTFISYLNNGKNVNILPILTGSFDESLDLNIYDKLIEIIKSNIKNKYKKVLFLSSGDMSHIGVKFGDLSNKVAKNITDVNNIEIEKIENINSFTYKKDKYLEFEGKVVKTFLENDILKYKEIMFQKNKDYRICGFAPFYSGLCFFPELKGTLINHNFTENIEEEFLVSYITMIFT